MIGWQSKADWPGKAHFVQADGKTACAAIGDLMKTKWKALDPTDHLCGFCRRVESAECRCARCSVKPTKPRTT